MVANHTGSTEELGWGTLGPDPSFQPPNAPFYSTSPLNDFQPGSLSTEPPSEGSPAEYEPVRADISVPATGNPPGASGLKRKADPELAHSDPQRPLIGSQAGDSSRHAARLLTESSIGPAHEKRSKQQNSESGRAGWTVADAASSDRQSRIHSKSGRGDEGEETRPPPISANRVLPNEIPQLLPHESVFPIQIGSELFKLSGASISSDGQLPSSYPCI